MARQLSFHFPQHRQVLTRQNPSKYPINQVVRKLIDAGGEGLRNWYTQNSERILGVTSRALAPAVPKPPQKAGVLQPGLTQDVSLIAAFLGQMSEVLGEGIRISDQEVLVINPKLQIGLRIPMDIVVPQDAPLRMNFQEYFKANKKIPLRLKDPTTEFRYTACMERPAQATCEVPPGMLSAAMAISGADDHRYGLNWIAWLPIQRHPTLGRAALVSTDGNRIFVGQVSTAPLDSAVMTPKKGKNQNFDTSSSNLLPRLVGSLKGAVLLEQTEVGVRCGPFVCLKNDFAFPNWEDAYSPSSKFDATFDYAQVAEMSTWLTEAQEKKSSSWFVNGRLYVGTEKYVNNRNQVYPTSIRVPDAFRCSIQTRFLLNIQDVFARQGSITLSGGGELSPVAFTQGNAAQGTRRLYLVMPQREEGNVFARVARYTNYATPLGTTDELLLPSQQNLSLSDLKAVLALMPDTMSRVQNKNELWFIGGRDVLRYVFDKSVVAGTFDTSELLKAIQTRNFGSVPVKAEPVALPMALTSLPSDTDSLELSVDTWDKVMRLAPVRAKAEVTWYEDQLILAYPDLAYVLFPVRVNPVAGNMSGLSPIVQWAAGEFWANDRFLATGNMITPLIPLKDHDYVAREYVCKKLKSDGVGLALAKYKTYKTFLGAVEKLSKTERQVVFKDGKLKIRHTDLATYKMPEFDDHTVKTSLLIDVLKMFSEDDRPILSVLKWQHYANFRYVLVFETRMLKVALVMEASA